MYRGEGCIGRFKSGGVKPGARKPCVGVRKCCFGSEDERSGLLSHVDQTKSGFFRGDRPLLVNTKDWGRVQGVVARGMTGWGEPEAATTAA